MSTDQKVIQPRRMAFQGTEFTSAEWLSVGTLLFLDIDDRCRWMDGNKVETPEFRYYCPACDKDFETQGITPTRCFLCGCDDAGEQAITMTHKGISGKVFPFYAPVK
jgi:hypothetical protein